MKATLFLSLAAGLFLAACQGTPTVQTGSAAEVVDSTLHRVNHSSLDKTYVNPATDFSQYSAVLIAPLDLDNVEIIQPTPSVRLPGNPKWQLTDRDKQDMREAYRKAIEEKLAASGRYTLTSDPGEGVLCIHASMKRLAPNAPKDDFDSRPAARTRIITEGAGDATIVFEFLDTQSGETVARAEDKWSDSSVWRINNSVTTRAEMQRMFRSWAIRVDNELQRSFGAQ